MFAYVYFIKAWFVETTKNMKTTPLHTVSGVINIVTFTF